MVLRIHPPNQGYLKAHSLYSNHFFRLVCSIAITTQKKNHIIECTLPLHVIYLFSHQYMCSCFCGLASILAEDIKPRASCTEEVLGYAHISIKGLSSVSVSLRASVFTECCRGTAAELKGSYAVSSHKIIQYNLSLFCFVFHHVSSDHSQIKSSFMIHQICFIHFRVILCS